VLEPIISTPVRIKTAQRTEQFSKLAMQNESLIFIVTHHIIAKHSHTQPQAMPVSKPMQEKILHASYFPLQQNISDDVFLLSFSSFALHSPRKYSQVTSKDNNADNTELSLFCIHNVFIVFWLNCIKRIMKHIREIVYEERAKRGVYAALWWKMETRECRRCDDNASSLCFGRMTLLFEISEIGKE
jgi:hypothetical protein